MTAQLLRFPRGKVAPIADDQPAWVCRECGMKHGRRCIPGVSTYHMGVCGACTKTLMVTEPRDFGYLKEGWKKK